MNWSYQWISVPMIPVILRDTFCYSFWNAIIYRPQIWLLHTAETTLVLIICLFDSSRNCYCSLQANHLFFVLSGSFLNSKKILHPLNWPSRVINISHQFLVFFFFWIYFLSYFLASYVGSYYIHSIANPSVEFFILTDSRAICWELPIFLG